MAYDGRIVCFCVVVWSTCRGVSGRVKRKSLCLSYPLVCRKCGDCFSGKGVKNTKTNRRPALVCPVVCWCVLKTTVPSARCFCSLLAGNRGMPILNLKTWPTSFRFTQILQSVLWTTERIVERLLEVLCPHVLPWNTWVRITTIQLHLISKVNTQSLPASWKIVNTKSKLYT